MLSASKLQVWNSGPHWNCDVFVSSHRRLNLRLHPHRRFASLILQSDDNVNASIEPSVSSNLTSAVGSSSSSALNLSQWTLTQRHIHILNFTACVAAISATWLFCSAIPALLAFKRAAESLEKLMDVTREELPDTMAAIRLSGMEISDLTMELSDIGQEITQGVRSSTRAVRLAEERLRRLTTMNPSVSLQATTPPGTETAGPALARIARGAKDGIVMGRAVVQILFTLTQYSRATTVPLNIGSSG
ncbi:unnamed protein product [Fraxinus pennsylvanica]|uniref:Uncharacterized protein n=1 Tax=Fraxinus pennsylvanica TaxID=56036 RepID=A0AAD2A278_9LAMI|nr:unnamed protein product [Fraxinus pennsylvanica]